MPAIVVLNELLTAGEKLITEHASANVLRDHLALVNTQLKMVVDENERLKKRVAELESLTGNLTRELQAKAIGQEFEEEYGVLFKRHPRGGYHKVPYCPRCKTPLGSIHGQIPFACTENCGFVSSVFAHQIDGIVSRLP